MTKFACFRKLMTMLVFPEVSKGKCQGLKKWKHFLYVLLYVIEIMLMYVNKTSLPDKV